MNYKIRYTETADEYIDEIIIFISRDSSKRAINFIDNLEQRIKKTIGSFPRVGTEYKEFRWFSFNKYVVVYDIDEQNKDVYIHMVTESHRNWKAIVDSWD